LLGCDHFPATGASRKCDSAHFRKAITVKISSPVTIRQTQANRFVNDGFQLHLDEICERLLHDFRCVTP